MSRVMARAKNTRNKSTRVNLSPGEGRDGGAINHQRPGSELKPPENPKGPVLEHLLSVSLWSCGEGTYPALPPHLPLLRPLPSGCSRATSFYDKRVTW